MIRLRAVFLVVFFSLTALPAALPAMAIEVQRVVSPGGIEAWLVEDHSNPIIATRLVFRGGAALDPKGREGLANMASTMLDEGAGELDSQAFQQTISDQAIRLGFSAGRESFSGDLTTLVAHRDQAFRLLRLALTEPRFDAEPLSRMRQHILIGLKRGEEDPNTLASRALMKTLFPGHPYSRPTKGTLASVAAITADDLRGFVKRRFGLDNLKIGVVGDITSKQLGQLLDSTFAGLSKKSTPWALPEITPAATDATIVIDKDVPQSAIVFAGPGLKRNDPDFYVAHVLNHILGGGGFTSRLYQEVREKRGLAYSVSTGLHPLDSSALIFGGAGTANARVGETLTVLRQQWRLMAESGVTDNELADAKTYLTGAFPLRFSSSDRIAGILVGMQLADLGIDYLDRRNGLIEAVSRQDIARLAKKMINDKRLLVVVAGRPAGMKATQ